MKNSNESPEQAVDHVRFQLDLLRLTAVPIFMSGPSIMSAAGAIGGNEEPEALRVMEELTTTVASLHRR